MDVVGEAADWATTLANAPATRLDMLLVEWALLPSMGVQALAKLRMACPNAIVIVLLSHLDARQQAALSAGADAFISKGEMPERVAERLRQAAASIPIRLVDRLIRLERPAHSAASIAGTNRGSFFN
jgi:DNA-binding NarL/FixJ family response regulator